MRRTDVRARTRPLPAPRVRCESDPANDVSVFASVNGWTVVLWPAHFNIHDVAAVGDISGRLGVLASTVHIYDGDYWAHSLFRSGVELNRFASMPGYFAEDPNGA